MSDSPLLVTADKKGRISVRPDLGPCGMEAGSFFKLEPSDLIRLPAESRVFLMPDRLAAGYDSKDGKFVVLEDESYAVAAFTPPGYTITHSSAYRESRRPKMLPLFAYAAVAHYKGSLFAAAVRIDKDRRHDSTLIDIGLVKNNIKKFRKIFPKNRLIGQLKFCALTTMCPNAQNFFLSRYECPLPSSPRCNARCAGCISFQPNKGCSASQPRIKFTPSPEELSQVALFHIRHAKDPIVSFGQGCEGEPLLAGEAIERAIRLIRRDTDKGQINLNTNGSLTEGLEKLFDAGLDSIRVSMNSAREPYYTRYYKPVRYSFGNVLDSISLAKHKKKFVSINYLTMPGFTDLKEEALAFKRLVKEYGVDMVQYRNLNFDPMLYFRELRLNPARTAILGIRKIIEDLKNELPRLMTGYFNPSKDRTTPD